MDDMWLRNEKQHPNNGHHVSMGINVGLDYPRVDTRHISIKPCTHLLEFYEQFLEIFSFFFI